MIRLWLFSLLLCMGLVAYADNQEGDPLATDSSSDSMPSNPNQSTGSNTPPLSNQQTIDNFFQNGDYKKLQKEHANPAFDMQGSSTDDD